MAIRAIVTDVEGTTTPISFVHQVMFPFAAKHMAEFIRLYENREDVALLMNDARALAERPELDTQGVIDLLLGWIAEDRKATPLKTIQGMIWDAGFRSGELVAHVYDDAISGLKRWHGEGLKLFVYSSGSVTAQKLLFGHTSKGDLTPLFSGYFDTTTGGKLEAASYAKISEKIGYLPSEILFLSDSVGELDAARDMGLLTVCLDRGEAVIPQDQTHLKVASFDEIRPEELA